MKTICSWCAAVMKDGKPPISHGCCPPCQVALLAEAITIPQVEMRIEEAERRR